MTTQATDPPQSSNASERTQDFSESKHELAHPSNTEQLDEFERQVLNRVAKAANPTQSTTVEGATYGIMKLVATHTAEAVRLARIDELQILANKDDVGTADFLDDSPMIRGYVEDRLAQLKNRQGGSNGK